jgi:RNA polymerase sigma-70 factor (ECF subfamily)
VSPSGTDPALDSAAALRELADADLLRRIAGRRQEALAELYDRHAPLLLAVARRILGNASDAEEVVQETLLQVWTQAGRYDPARSSATTWLVLLTRSRAIDLLRSRGVRQRAAVASALELPAAHTSPEGPRAVLTEERQARVRTALAELPVEQRGVLELAFFGGLSQSEIAERTGIPLGTVKTRTLLAMRKLRQSLREEMRELL